MFSRLIAAAIVLATAAGLAIIAWPQLFGLSGAPVIAQVVSLRAAGAIVALVLAILLGLIALTAPRTRGFLGSMVALLVAFCLLNTVVLASRGFGTSEPDQANDDAITILSWNTLGDAPGADRIATLALDQGAQVVVLPETSRETGQAVADAMGASGVSMTAYTASYDLVLKARSTTLLISNELGEYDVDTETETTSVLPSLVAVPRDTRAPIIAAVHPVAPIPGEMSRWRSDLRLLTTFCDGSNTIMAGDFNSTMDHYSGLATAPGAAIGNCFDAANATDNAAVGSWPTALPALLGAPIDHVMATADWRVASMSVIHGEDDSGSDHRPVVAHLVPVNP